MIPNLHSFLAWVCKNAKITSWKTNDKELTAAMNPQGRERVGSFREQNAAGEEYEGIQVILPIPNPPKKKKK